MPSKYYEYHRQWILEHPEKNAEYARRYKQNHPERRRENRKRYYEKHKKEIIPKVVEYHRNHPEIGRAAAKRCYHRHIDRYRIKSRLNFHRYTARKNGNGGSHTQEEWIELCNGFGNKCLRCGNQVKLTEDHIIPISRGGTDNIDNIQPLCMPCNSGKRDKTVDYRNKESRCAIFN